MRDLETQITGYWSNSSRIY